jgi:hypothetical protein
MRSDLPLLQNVKVAAPCNAAWDAMTPLGDDGERARHCGQCNLNVYNLSALTQGEAEGLLRSHEGRLCVRYYQRADGTILTQDCPVGTAAVRVNMIRKSRAAAVLTLLIGTGALGATLLNSSAKSATMGKPSCALEPPVPAASASIGSTVPRAEMPQSVQSASPPTAQMLQGEVALLHKTSSRQTQSPGSKDKKHRDAGE